MNLTAVTDNAEIVNKHFLDAVDVLNHFPMASGDAVIDIGTGAGFPGLPIKIYNDGIRLTLLEASQKKVSFLRFLIARLGQETGLETSSIRVISQRAEIAATQPEHHHAYDWVLTRYVASLGDSMSYCLPFLKPNGTWLAYKAKNAEAEMREAEVKLKSFAANVRLTATHSRIAELNRVYIAVQVKEFH